MIYCCLLLMAFILFYMSAQTIPILITPEITESKIMGERTRKQLLYTAFIFGLLMAICCSMINPPNEWDLYRHYCEIDKMRVLGAKYAFSYGTYKELYVINFMFYLVSLTKYDGLLVFVSLMIETIIFCYFMNDQIRSGKIVHAGVFAICFLAFWPTLNIVYAVSGIRNVLAASIGTFALYADVMKKKPKIVTILLYLTAVFIHPFAIVFIVLRLLVNLKQVWLSTLIALGWFALYDLIYYLCRMVPLKLFQVISVNMYLHENDYSSDIRLTVMYALFVAAIIIMALIDRKHNKFNLSEVELRWNTVALLYGAFTIGALSNVLYFERAAYGIAFVMLPIVSRRMKNKNRLFPSLVLCVYAMIAIMFQVVRMYNVVVNGG